jgi:hypothetical protein
LQAWPVESSEQIQIDRMLARRLDVVDVVTGAKGCLSSNKNTRASVASSAPVLDFFCC